MGHGVVRGNRPGYHPWSCGDRAGVLPAPAGGVVVSVGCTVFFQTWRGGVPWTLQAKVLHTHVRQRQRGAWWSRNPPGGVLARALRGPGVTRRFRTPLGGRSGPPAASAERPPLGTVATPDPFPSRGRVRTAGVGRIVTGTVPSTSHPASRVPTVLPQRPGWRSSDRSWRTGLRSEPLWGMAA